MPRPTTRARVASTRTTTADLNDENDGSGSKSKGKGKQSGPSSALNSSIISHSASNSLKALKNSRQRADSALDRLANMTSTASDATEEPQYRFDSSIEVGRRGDSTPLHARLPEYSGLDLDDDAFDDLDTTLDLAGPASAVRSNDTSTLSTSQFKRRRAGSFLSHDAPLRPSSRAGPNTPGISSTFNIGVFKRRAREPSILGTAQKPRAQQPAEPDSDGDLGVEDADDFAPEAESTPFKNTKRRSGVADAGGPSDLAPSSPGSRKRKSAEGHERRRRTSPRSGSPAPIPSVEASPSVPASSPALRSLRGGESRPVTPEREELDPAILAPPMSSGSSEGEADIWPPIKALAKGRAKRPVSGLRRTPIQSDDESDISSPPSLTHSPNYPEPSPPPRPTRRKVTKTVPPKKETQFTTAHLTGLLPRRRQRIVRADEEDESEGEVDISGLGQHDDELSLNVRGRRRPATRNQHAPVPAVKATRSRGRPKKSVAAAAAAAPASDDAPPKNKRLSHTYGRTSDKENEGDDSSVLSELEEGEGEGGEDSLAPIGDDEDETEGNTTSQPGGNGRLGSELRDAVRKFQEVDKWELEYEEGMRSSSPPLAR